MRATDQQRVYHRVGTAGNLLLPRGRVAHLEAGLGRRGGVDTGLDSAARAGESYLAASA